MRFWPLKEARVTPPITNKPPNELDQSDSLTQRKYRHHGGEYRDEIQED